MTCKKSFLFCKDFSKGKFTLNNIQFHIDKRLFVLWYGNTNQWRWNMSNKIIEVQNIKINITSIDDNDYICISDFGKFKEGKSKADDVIRNWLRNRITLEFLGTWESIYNPNFNSVEFDGFRRTAGLHTFTLSVTEWCEITNAIGIYSKRGKYGGTYAHKDIAFEFASSISPVFKLFV